MHFSVCVCVCVSVFERVCMSEVNVGQQRPDVPDDRHTGHPAVNIFSSPAGLEESTDSRPGG